VTIALLWIGSLALWFALKALRIDAPLTLDLRGVPAVGTVAAVVLGVAWLLAHLTAVSFRRTLWLVSGYLPAVAAAGWALGAHLMPAAFAAIASALATHAALYFFFGLRALSGQAEWRGWIGVTLSVLGLLALDLHMQVDPSLWAERQTPEQVAHQRESAARAEDLMYAQPERIEAALRAMSREPASLPACSSWGSRGSESRRSSRRRLHWRRIAFTSATTPTVAGSSS
jgi:hypothetical protein